MEPRTIQSAKTSSTNHSITADELSDGGASHRYSIAWDNHGYIGSNGIVFQKGPVKEHGHNGVQNEDLLRIVADRLTCFESGDYACTENARALTCVLAALDHLNERTRNRESRGVEGTNES